MPFTVPTIDELHAFLLALTKALLPARDTSQPSRAWRETRTMAGAVTDLHAHLDAVKDDVLPDKAEGDALDRWGTILGVPRKAATGARKSAALRVTAPAGGGGGAVAPGDVLTHVSGLRFQVTESEAIAAGNTADVDVAAIDTGADTRLNAGETLTFSSPPAGLEEEAILVLDLDEDGTDKELDGPYRLRILERLANPPLGGAQADYVQWATAVTGIAEAYCYPLRQGLGSVDLAALHEGSGSARLLLAGEITDLQATIDALRPVDVTFRVLTVEATDVDVEVTIVPNGDALYAFDWDDSTPLEVSTWTAGTKTLKFTTDRPASMLPNGRITIKPAAGGGDGAQLVIESLSGTDSVILEEAPATAPVATDTVYAGGELVDPVRDAIIAHIDSLGTSNTDAVPYGTWEANLRPQNLYRISQGIDGVRSSTVVDPAATVEPADNAYPDDGTVYILAPRQILVRWEH